METTLNSKSKSLMSEKIKEMFFDIVCYIFILLFIYTAYSKFMDIDGFKVILSRSPLTDSFSGFIAWGVPLIESVISILLIIPLTKKVGLLASLALMILFTAFLIYGILSGSKLPCHCGGIISSMSWKQHIWLNVTFIVLALGGIMAYKRK